MITSTSFRGFQYSYSLFAFVALAAALLLSVAPLSPAYATETQADTNDYQAVQNASTPITDAIPSEIQERVEQTAQAYNDAVAARQELETQIQNNQQQIDQLQAQIPELQDRAADAIRTSYKYRQRPDLLLDLVLSSQDFSTFISTITYLDSVQELQTSSIQELTEAQAQLEQTQSDLNAQLEQAQEQEAAAEEALTEAKAAREEAQRQAEAAAAAAEAARQAAAQAQATAAQQNQTSNGQAQDQTSTTDTDVAQNQGEEAASAAASESSTAAAASTVNLSSDRDVFINEWASRINAYLSGSPMAGEGATFAAAAWDYGVDPRISPAIAMVESGLGVACFLPYNAWGWGSASWSSWDEAIYAHVSGFARGYGSTLDYSDAESYCPSDPSGWYANVTAQMGAI